MNEYTESFDRLIRIMYDLREKCPWDKKQTIHTLRQMTLEETDDDVKRNWENLKLKEGKKSVLSGVPKTLPALVKAMRLQEKAKQVGFEWENKEQVWDKVEEEQKELK